jgi:hypothetical protein
VILVSVVSILVVPTEYREGYSAGYSEHNETKYQAAEKICKNWLVYESNQTAYAEGYCLGYVDYWSNQKALVYKAEHKAEQNETLKILGI